MLSNDLPVKSYIKYHYGNLISLFKAGEFDAIAHGCNCFNALKSGIAATIAQEIPEAVLADNRTKSADRSKLGTYTYVETPHGVLYNAYTQYTTWDPTDMLSYDAVRSVFNAINVDMKIRGLIGLGIPRIGAVRAGGDWGTILQIISEECTDVEVHYVEYNGTINR